MWEYKDQDRHYTGVFNVEGDIISGEIIYNKGNGTILLVLEKEINEKNTLNKNYGNIHTITGKLNTGASVTLFENRCVLNHEQVFQYQTLEFISQRMIFAHQDASDATFDEMVCVLGNALSWGDLSPFQTTDDFSLKVVDKAQTVTFGWYGVKITFEPYLNNWLIIPKEEENKIIQKLQVRIELDEKRSLKEMINVRDKIIALISFGIRDNVNVEKQYLINRDEYIQQKDFRDYYKYHLFINEPYLKLLKTNRWNFNFKLSQLNQDNDYSDALSKLVPVFNLYMSLFRYSDMPAEMVFLNIIQAVETFHARFYYDNKLSKYIEYVNSNYPEGLTINKLLLTDEQKKANRIFLLSRINDLLVRAHGVSFNRFIIGKDRDFASRVVISRNYYTHYDKSKEDKALKGKDLYKAIYILRLLLEYSVCQVLGIDIKMRIQRDLNTME